MSYENVSYETLNKGRIAHITLNRPEYRNAQSRELLEDLDAAFDEAVFDNVACTAKCKGASTRAVLQRGDDVIEADDIFFDLCKGLVHARGRATVSVKGETAAE